MKEKIDLTELEGLALEELVDLGDAAEETRQISPWPVYLDSVYQWGEWSR